LKKEFEVEIFLTADFTDCAEKLATNPFDTSTSSVQAGSGQAVLGVTANEALISLEKRGKLTEQKTDFAHPHN